MYTTKLFLDDFVFRKLATELVGDVGTAGAGEKLNPIILVQYKRMDGEYSFRFQFQFGRFESKASRRVGRARAGGPIIENGCLSRNARVHGRRRSGRDRATKCVRVRL